MIEGMVVIGQERRVGFVRRLRRAWLVVVVWIFACFRLGRGKGGKGGQMEGEGERIGDGNWHKEVGSKATGKEGRKKRGK